VDREAWKTIAVNGGKTMVASVQMLASEDRARGRDTKITLADLPTEGLIRIGHDDGSVFLLANARVEDDPEDEHFIWVFAEHHGPFVFARNEVVIWTPYKAVT
jgi:hypothetical protein